jgi:hypothetical protein
MRFFCLALLMINLIAVHAHAQTKKSKSFFPIAVWLQNPDYARQYRQDGGINLYIGLWNPLDEKQLSQIKEAGIQLICEQNAFGLAHRSDPAIYGWMHGDEPDNAQWNEKTKTYDPCISPADIISYYNEIKQKDADHPFYLNLGQGVSYTSWFGRGECTGKTEMYPEYLKGCDIASFDIYPVNSKDSIIKDKLWMGAKGIDSLKSWTNNSKPVYTWIETTLIGKDSPRKPTPEEVKTQVWMALIHEANGIGYFCHSFYPENDDAALLHDKKMLSAVKEINNTITNLAQVLNSDTQQNYASVNSSNSKVPVHIMAKKQGKIHYLFAVAMRNQETMASFKVSSGKEIEVIGENRKIKVVNGQFEDHFKGYDVHLYKIN